MAIPYHTLIRPVVTRLASDFGIKGGAAAEAMLGAIGLQESGFATRDQMDAGPPVLGPATGFWQFERTGGVRGVMRHPASRDVAKTLILESGTPPEEDAVWRLFATVQGDELACVFARLLLFTDPVALPPPVLSAEAEAWACYLRNWRPGRPRREHWGPFWRDACSAVGTGSADPLTELVSAFPVLPTPGAGPRERGMLGTRLWDLAAVEQRLTRLEAQVAALARQPGADRPPAPSPAAAAGETPEQCLANRVAITSENSGSFRVPFDVLDAFERAAEYAADRAGGACAPAETPEQATIDFGSNAESADVTDFSRKVLQDIMRNAGLVRIQVSSTARGPADQARVMFDNLERYGIAHQKALYGPAGDQVIDVYREAKLAGRDTAAIKGLMTEEIIRIGPTRVSRHASDPKVLNVFDIAPSSVARPRVFEEAVRADKRVSRFITPPQDPGYHLEIPQLPAQV